jgi:hypothetical protein
MQKMLGVFLEAAGQFVAILAVIYVSAKVLQLALESILRMLRAYLYFCEYIIHRKSFRKWLVANCEHNKGPVLTPSILVRDKDEYEPPQEEQLL